MTVHLHARVYAVEVEYNRRPNAYTYTMLHIKVPQTLRVTVHRQIQRHIISAKSSGGIYIPDMAHLAMLGQLAVIVRGYRVNQSS